MRRLSYEKRDIGYSFALVTFIMVAAALLLDLIFSSPSSGWQFWLMQGLYTLLIGSSAFLYAVLSKTKVFVATKLNKVPNPWHTLWGCGAVAFLILCMSQVNTLFLDLIEAMNLPRPAVQLDTSVVGLIICACILPAFTEEIVFRGTVAQSLYGNKNKLAALAISGALFAIFHANPAQTLHQFVLGAFLTLLVFRSGSLWTGIIVHLFNNALVVGLSYTPMGSDEFWNLTINTTWALTLTLVGIVGFALCVFGYVKITKSGWHTAEPDSTQADESAQIVAKNQIKKSYATLLVAVAVCVVLWIAQLLV